MAASHFFHGKAMGLQQALNETVDEYEGEVDSLSNDVAKLQSQVTDLKARLKWTSELNAEKHSWLMKTGSLNVGRARYRLENFARDLINEHLGDRYFLDEEQVRDLPMDLKREINLRILVQAEYYMTQEYSYRDLVEFTFHSAVNPDLSHGKAADEGGKIHPLNAGFHRLLRNHNDLVLMDHKGNTANEKVFVNRRLREWKKFGKYPVENAFPTVSMDQVDSHGDPFLVLSVAEREYLKVGKKGSNQEDFKYEDISHPLKEDCWKKGESPLIPEVTFIKI